VTESPRKASSEEAHKKPCRLFIFGQNLILEGPLRSDKKEGFSFWGRRRGRARGRGMSPEGQKKRESIHYFTGEILSEGFVSQDEGHSLWWEDRRRRNGEEKGTGGHYLFGA